MTSFAMSKRGERAMLTVYMVCAGVGSALLLLQFALTLFGIGGEDADAGHVDADFHGDIDGDFHADGHAGAHDAHDSSWFFGMLSFRTLVAAIAFFGLAGMAGTKAGMSPYISFVAAVAAGSAALFVVAWIMRTMYGLDSEGTVHIESAMGQVASVYLPIPANKSGAGKVTVKIQDRTMEYQAITSEDALSTGARVVVTGIVGSDTLEVEPTKE